MKLAIYGYGGCALDIAPWARALGHEVVFVSDGAVEPYEGDRIVALEDLDVDGVVVAVATPSVRRRLVKKVEAFGLPFASLFAPTHIQRGPSLVGEGAAFHDRTMITANSRVGRHCIANAFSYIAHDCIIGDFVTLCPRATVNGNVHIGDGVFIGSGAIIRNGTPDRPLVIGAGAYICMNAAVTKDVPRGGRVEPRGQAADPHPMITPRAWRQPSTSPHPLTMQ